MIAAKKKKGPHGSGMPERPCPGGKEIGGNPGRDSTQSQPGWASARRRTRVSAHLPPCNLLELAFHLSADRQPRRWLPLKQRPCQEPRRPDPNRPLCGGLGRNPWLRLDLQRSGGITTGLQSPPIAFVNVSSHLPEARPSRRRFLQRAAAGGPCQNRRWSKHLRRCLQSANQPRIVRDPPIGSTCGRETGGCRNYNAG